LSPHHTAYENIIDRSHYVASRITHFCSPLNSSTAKVIYNHTTPLHRDISEIGKVYPTNDSTRNYRQRNENPY
jgi:hypothetical protein